MKRLITALAVFCAATPALAQDRMVQEECLQSWEGVFALTGLPAAQVMIEVDASGWCGIEEGAVDFGSGAGVRLDTLKWRASAIERFTENGLPPRSLEITGTGLGILRRTGDPVLDYVLGVQSEGSQLDFGLSARWDGVQNALVVDEGYVAFDDTNRIDLTLRLDGLDLTDTASIQSSFGTMGLRSLTLKSTFDGWFEAFVASPLALALLTNSGTSPEEQVADLKWQAINFTSTFPDEFLPDVAKDAIASFILQLPQPRGTLQVQLNAEPVVGMMRLAPLGFAAPLQSAEDVPSEVIDGVRVLVTWSPRQE